MTQQLSGSFGKMERNALRMSDGDRISASGDDSGNLSVSLKVRARQKITAKKIENVGNAISFLQVQEGVLNSAKRIMDRIGILKAMYEDPAKSVSDKANYDMEFKELAEQLQELKNETFNGISLFSDTGSGFALNEGSAREFSAAMNDSDKISISQNVIDFEDLRRMGEAGEAVSRGFGGLKVINFPVKDSVAQVETITIGGRVAQGDEFTIRIIEQSSVLETESDATFTYTATAADEAAANPNQNIRDALVSLINADGNITNFVTVDNPTNNSFTLTSKMAGDPFTVTSGSTGSTGSFSETQIDPNIPKVAQVDDLTINLNGNAIALGDTISVEVNGLPPITYTATAFDSNEFDLVSGLANAINVSAAGASVSATASGFNTLEIEAITAGTPFTLTNPSISIASGVGETITPANLIANFAGQAQVEEVTIGADDSSPGGGQIAAGDRYRVRINGLTLTATAAAGATSDILKNDLIGQINGAGLGVTASSTGAGEFTITANDPGIGFTFSISSNLSQDSLSSNTTIPNVSPFSILKSMNFLSEMLSQNAAEQQRLKLSQQHLSSNRMQYEVADGRIRDLDIASESTSYAKNQVRTQILQSFLTQANASAANILSLIT